VRGETLWVDVHWVCAKMDVGEGFVAGRVVALEVFCVVQGRVTRELLVQVPVYVSV
jgi:hypothetical protein